MSENSNGYFRDSLDLCKSEKATEGSSFDIELVFRDFQKKPVVVCERYNIKPYLHKMELDLPPDLRGPTFVSVHDIAKYDKKCSVRLRRENLEQLKEELLSNRHIVYTTSFTCNICQEVYLSEEKLLNHQETKHITCYKPENKVRKKVSFSDEIIVHEVKEYHRCRKCPKIFEDYGSLKVHMREIHKKRKCYVCFYCSKDFVDRMFFKVHIKLHCDACGLLLPNRKSYLEHRRNTCKIVKKYVCKTCNISLFYFMDLKDHSYEHLGQFYICDICKDRFDDKCALSHHIKFLHAKRRPKILYTTQYTMGEDTVYACKFCDVSCAERELIERHVSTFPEYNKCAMTGYKDFYFCDQCFEKFGTETDMLRHKWSHFLKSAQQNVADLPQPVNLLNKMEVLTDNMIQKAQNNNTEDIAEILIDSTTQNTQIINTQPIKLVYNIKTDKLPPLLEPRIVLEKLILPQTSMLEKLLSEQKNKNIPPIDAIDLTNLDPTTLKKPKNARKRTLLSRHQCQLCLRYFSNSYCLTRHLYAIHGLSKDTNMPYKAKNGDLRCSSCEEDFALPSLLQNHNCIRKHIPEMPFQDARPDIHLDTSVFSQHNGFDDIDYNDDYMNSIDFEIPAPIVELTEYENVNLVLNDNDTVSNERPFHGQINGSIVNNNLSANNVTPFTNVPVNNHRPFGNMPVNNVRPYFGPGNNLSAYNVRPFGNMPVNNVRQYAGPRTKNNLSANVRPFPNMTVNNHRPFGNNPANNVGQYVAPRNNLSANDVRPFPNVTVNNRQFASLSNHMTANNVRPLINLTVNNDGQLNMVPVNGPLNNEQSNDVNSGKRCRYIFVQEVPIEF